MKKEIIISQINLAPNQIQLLNQKTPEMFVKERPVRGGKKARYVEVGYVINQLNTIFGAPNWDFEIVEQGTTERKNETNTVGEVWVRGKLTVIDHKHDYRVGKTQYGQHNIHTGVPIGDAFKAASSDALKKCASMFGIGLDVMWTQLDDLAQKGTTQKINQSTEKSPEELFEVAEKMIKSCKNPSQIIVIDEKVQASKKFNKTQKEKLHNLANAYVEKLDSNS